VRRGFIARNQGADTVGKQSAVTGGLSQPAAIFQVGDLNQPTRAANATHAWRHFGRCE